jgi:hypothetical protein
MTIIRRRAGCEPIIKVLESGSSPENQDRRRPTGEGGWRREMGAFESGRKIIGILVVVAIGQVIG